MQRKIIIIKQKTDAKQKQIKNRSHFIFAFFLNESKKKHTTNKQHQQKMGEKTRKPNKTKQEKQG